MSSSNTIPSSADTLSGESVRSGEKYLTPQGFSAIKDGIRSRGAQAPGGLVGKPSWLRAQIAMGEGYDFVRRTVREHRLATVCEEARCPNIGECWNAGTATIMLMGSVCTRACRFCAVEPSASKPATNTCARSVLNSIFFHSATRSRSAR